MEKNNQANQANQDFESSYVRDPEEVTNAVVILQANQILKISADTGEATLDLGAMAEAAGLLGAAIQAGKQLMSKDVDGKTLTITEASLVKKPPDWLTEEDPYYVSVRFAELPDAYYNGGGMLTQLFTAYARAFGDPWVAGPLIKVNELIRKQGGLPLRFIIKPSKRNPGQDYTMIYPA